MRMFFASIHATLEMAKARGRRASLGSALGELNLSIPVHSRLCERYVAGHPTSPNYMGKRWELSEVVVRVAQLKWLHEHTDYRRRCDAVADELRDAGVNLREIEFTFGVEEEIVAELGGWPKRWPWLPEPRSWSPRTHGRFEPEVKRTARAVLLCCFRLGIASDIAKAIIEKWIAEK